MEEKYTPEIYFSFFMFTANLEPEKPGSADIFIKHIVELTKQGYTGFDLHIAAPIAKENFKLDLDNYKRLKDSFNKAGLESVKFTTNVGTTQLFDPTSPYHEQRAHALLYLKSRVDITSELAGGQSSIMSGPFLYPYGVFPLNVLGESIWSDVLLEWMEPRFKAAIPVFCELAEYAQSKNVQLAIEPVKSWETPPPNMVSEVLDFIDSMNTSFPIGVTFDTAQIMMESQGQSYFKKNVERAAIGKSLSFVHISAPDRGAINADSWIPWDIMLGEFKKFYRGPYLIEVFNAIPPFINSMRMARRKFWRPEQDEKQPGFPSAYDIAKDALNELKTRLS